ncbi:MAG: MBL fold metallo-hydrolase [Gemmatimonadales bacterium]
MGRAADARVRAQVHHAAAAPGTPGDPGPAGRRPAAPRGRGRLRRLVARPGLSHRHSRRARRGAVSAERRRQPRDVPGAAHDGERGAVARRARRGLVYTGDTGPSSELARWASGCDLLLAECSLPEAMAMDIHLTPERAGDMAREAAAKRLVLTHFYPPVETSDPTPATLAGTRFPGPVVAARDGDRFTVGDGRS